MDIVAKFEGEEAARHLLPAYEGTQSLEGIARTVTLGSHFATTGIVRKKYPFVNSAPVYLSPAKEGSFESLFSLLIDTSSPFVTTPLGALSVSVAGGLIVELLIIVCKWSFGRDHTPKTPEASQLLAERGGDLAALQEAVEPALKKAHTVINNGAGQIFLISGSNNIVNMNAQTKNYIMHTERETTTRLSLVSVGMLNANTRNGRVYNAQLGRTVPIYVSRDANPRTLSNLARSLQRYSAQTGLRSNVNIVYTAEKAVDGTDKKYIVEDAFFPPD